MKIIRVTTDNIVTTHDYPSGNYSQQNTVLAELIADNCEVVERVKPRRLYEKLKVDKMVSMLVDEEGLLRDDIIVNPIGSYLYECDKHGIPIAGNVLFIGEYIDNFGNIVFGGLDDITFKKLKIMLEKMVKTLQ